jgi:glycosyltransferase involved in cell wall biosynthesis
MIADLCDPSFDLIWVERLISTGLIPQSVRGRVIVDLDDIQYRKMGHRLRQPRLHPLTLLDVLEFFKLRRVERKLVRGSGEYIVCSDLDKCALGGGEQIVVLPNGIDLPASGPAPLSSVDPPLLVLVGTMRTEANVDAAHFFVQRILPEIRRAVSHVRLMIVGSDPTESVRRLHDGHTVVVTGTVPRVEPYLRDAAISVVPIRFGGGTRIKILESLAHGVPLVSTTVGAEGLDVVDGRHLLLADSPAQFAAACVRLLRDVSLRRLLSQEGSELVRNMYDWAAIERRVQALVTGGPSPVDRALASLRKAGYTNPASP